MSHELLAAITCQSEDDVDAIIAGRLGDYEIPDVYTRVYLLAQALPTGYKDHARVGDRRRGTKGYKGLVHTDNALYTQKTISSARRRMEGLNLWNPTLPDLSELPFYSAFLVLEFILSRPYISRDDVILHINDNPVRKEKVFKVPMMDASGWKGALRRAAVQTRLVISRNGLSVEEFAQERLALALLFGDEKGEEASQMKNLAAFLDELKPGNGPVYRRLAQDHFSGELGTIRIPRHAGRLRFYSTYFTQIGLEVINPHDRKTGAGKQPIYFECVPAGAEGIFALLYIPFDLIGRPHDEILRQAEADLKRIAEAVGAMMRTYGFGAKTSSGYGIAEDGVSGMIRTGAGAWPITHLSQLTEEVPDVEF